jgi:hypothetical protein
MEYELILTDATETPNFEEKFLEPVFKRIKIPNFQYFFSKFCQKCSEYIKYSLRFFIIAEEKFFENLEFALLNTGSKIY